MIEYFKTLTRLTKSLFTIAFILLVYGYLCRIAGIYFFRESKTLGLELLFIALIKLLIERIRWKKQQVKKVVGEKIAIAFVAFILLIQSIIFFATPKTDAYSAAKEFLSTDEVLKNQVGEIKGLFLKPVGSISMSSSAERQWGVANLHFIVKGNKKYKDVNLYLVKILTPGG